MKKRGKWIEQDINIVAANSRAAVEKYANDQYPKAHQIKINEVE